MTVRNGNAEWTGSLRDGKGTFSVGSGSVEGAYSFGTRFEEDPGTNPEELIAAAHAACYSMALSGDLGKAGHTPESVSTAANLRLEKQDIGFTITGIQLQTVARVPGIGDEEFQQIAGGTKEGCPVSRALAAVPIELEASLSS
jgi:osmotically inducible protein OsmC